MANPDLFAAIVIDPKTLDFSTTRCNSNQMYVLFGIQFCPNNISAHTYIIFLSAPLVCFLHVCVLTRVKESAVEGWAKLCNGQLKRTILLFGN